MKTFFTTLALTALVAGSQINDDDIVYPLLAQLMDENEDGGMLHRKLPF